MAETKPIFVIDSRRLRIMLHRGTLLALLALLVAPCFVHAQEACSLSSGSKDDPKVFKGTATVPTGKLRAEAIFYYDTDNWSLMVIEPSCQRKILASSTAPARPNSWYGALKR